MELETTTLNGQNSVDGNESLADLETACDRTPRIFGKLDLPKQEGAETFRCVIDGRELPAHLAMVPELGAIAKKIGRVVEEEDLLAERICKRHASAVRESGVEVKFYAFERSLELVRDRAADRESQATEAAALDSYLSSFGKGGGHRAPIDQSAEPMRGNRPLSGLGSKPRPKKNRPEARPEKGGGNAQRYS